MSERKVLIIITGSCLERNQRIRIKTKPKVNVLRVKKVIRKVTQIPIWQQVLKYRGLYTLQNSRHLSDYGIGDEETVTESTPGYYRHSLRLIRSFDNPSKKAFYSSANFRSLYKQRKRGKYEKTDFVLDLSQIERLGFNGPLVIILQYICPIEALFNTCLVSRMFYETVFNMLSNDFFRLTDEHLYILLGKDSLHINELLFIKLCSLRNFFFEMTLIPTQLPIHPSTNLPTHTLDLIRICVKNNFLDALKYLYFEKGMKKLETVNSSRYNVNHLEYCFQLNEIKFKEMFFFLTEHYSGFSKIERHHVGVFLVEGEWNKLIKLLKNENNPRIPSDIIKAYSTFAYFEVKRKGKKKHPYFTLQKWIELEKVVEISSIETTTFRLFEIPSVLNSIASIFSICDWDLVDYFLCKKNEDIIIPENINFRLKEDFLNRDGFFEFFFKNIDRLRIEYSQPLFDLYRACLVDNDLEKLKNIVEGLEGENPESTIPRDFKFLFLKVIDIPNMTPVLRRIFQIFQSHYVEALEKKILDFVELFSVENVLGFEMDLLRSGGQLASEMVIHNLNNLCLGRCDFALELYEGLRKKEKVGLSSSRKAIHTSKILYFLLTYPDKNSEVLKKVILSELFEQQNETPFLCLIDIFIKILGRTERKKHSNLVLEESKNLFCELILKWNFESKFASRGSICRYIFKRVLDHDLVEVGKVLISQKPEWENNSIALHFLRNPHGYENVTSFLMKEIIV